MPLTVQACQDHQIGCQHTPADPLLEALIAMTRATGQLHRAFDDADSPFDPVPKTLTLFEPGKLFMALPASIMIPGLGQDDMPDPHPPGERFVLGRKRSTIHGE